MVTGQTPPLSPSPDSQQHQHTHRTFVTTTHFRVEKDLRSEKSFVADIDVERLFRDGVLALMHSDPLRRLRIVLSELLHDVRTHVRVLLLKSKKKTETTVYQIYEIRRFVVST